MSETPLTAPVRQPGLHAAFLPVWTTALTSDVSAIAMMHFLTGGRTA